MTEAAQLIGDIISGLEQAAVMVEGQLADDRTYAEIWGWNQPSVNRHEVAALLRDQQKPLTDLLNTPDLQIRDYTFSKLSLVPQRIAFLTSSVIPNFNGNNAYQCYVAVLSVVENMRVILSPYGPQPIDFQDIVDRQLLPAAQIRRIKSVDSNIERLIGDAGALDVKIALINDAHSTAEALPTDLAMLKDARKSIADTLKQSQVHQAGAETARKLSEDKLADITKKHDQAVRLVQGTEAAFSAATTKGLGEEFGNRATELSNEVRWLGGFLAATLLIGGVITYFRLERVNTIISQPSFSSQALWAHVGLSIVSVAAPVWLAWLLTKQIGQRFRLSEDYAFKASVAKAYAGYSQEAARIDPEFQKRLYQTALTRIDEEPLRYVESDNHGSPFHEILGKRFGRQTNGATSAVKDTPPATG